MDQNNKSTDRKRRVRRTLVATRRTPAAFAARSRRVRLLILSGLAAVAVALAGTGTAFTWASAAAARLDHERDGALAAATQRIPKLLSFHAPTLDAEAAQARNNLTGPFAQEYGHLLDSVVLPGTRSGTLSTDARIVRAGTVHAEPGHVDVLVYINQSTTSPGHPQPAASASRATVRMSKVGDQWLISGLTPM